MNELMAVGFIFAIGLFVIVFGAICDGLRELCDRIGFEIWLIRDRRARKKRMKARGKYNV